MTSFRRLFYVTWQPKFRNANHLLFFNLLALVLTMLYQLWEVGFAELEMVGPVILWGVAFGLLTFGCLTWRSERLLVADSYRLLPAGDAKLYFSNLSSSFAIMVYWGLIQAILLVLGSAMNGRIVRQWFRQVMHVTLTAQDWDQLQVYGASIVAYGALILLWIWAFLTLIHFATNAISAFIPGRSQKVIKAILAVALTWIVVVFLSWVSTIELKFFRMINSTETFNFVFDFIYLGLAVVVASWLNVYLMHRWVETRPAS